MLLVLKMIKQEKKNMLNSFLFREASSCPLKMQYLLELSPDLKKSIPYKSKTKIMMRRALSLIYPGGKVADDDHETAIGQTQRWLNNKSSIVYGGMAAYENFHARLPVTVRDGDTLTLLQIHGKAWKSRNKSLEYLTTNNRKINEYVREAAYKKWILNQRYPHLNITIRLCFPNPGFQSNVHNLYEKIAYKEAVGSDVDLLFTEIEADEAVQKIWNQTGNSNLHPFYRDKSFVDQISWIGEELLNPVFSAPFIITDACKMCSFRSAAVENRWEGCWEKHLDGKYRYSGRHIYDLIGHGNDWEVEKGNYLKENVSLPMGVKSFEDVKRRGGGSITILQRRVLQLLNARDKPLPRVWLKDKLKKMIRNISYPLHFIDFEAVTSPIPMHKDGKPYHPVFFQFSCHTMHKDGNVVQHHWLDKKKRGHPHKRFIKKLHAVPLIEKGTILQYSPFEKQALKTLYRECTNTNYNDNQLSGMLRKILNGNTGTEGDRFLDMNRLVRDYFYNSNMVTGLGLKQVLYSTLKSSRYLRDHYRNPVEVDGMKIDIVNETEQGLSDPYSLIQKNGEIIDDGSAAMHGWLHTKTPYCSDSKRTEIHHALIRYCTLDSLALVMIFQEWLHLIEEHESAGDIVVNE